MSGVTMHKVIVFESLHDTEIETGNTLFNCAGPVSKLEGVRHNLLNSENVLLYMLQSTKPSGITQAWRWPRAASIDLMEESV